MVTGRERKVLMYTLYHMEVLRVDGLCEFDFTLPDTTLDEGKAVVDSGFIPTRDEYRFALWGFKDEGGFRLTERGTRLADKIPDESLTPDGEQDRN